ncbi:hypothetical protein [Methyloversatilis thermotolerans]|uniref:hypothetical protein n=1 Tax=Methyloversatilis thermotolerans TaxID=1346290 RepID=UPI00037AC94A|nr:hypothetical protein [Methyloversatilis thermotolerans]
MLGLTRDEFFTALPCAVDLPMVHRAGGANGRGWSLAVDIQPPLSIAPQGLPRLRVQIEFTGRDAAYIEAFMARFDRHFRLASA